MNDVLLNSDNAAEDAGCGEEAGEAWLLPTFCEIWCVARVNRQEETFNAPAEIDQEEPISQSLGEGQVMHGPIRGGDGEKSSGYSEEQPLSVF